MPTHMAELDSKGAVDMLMMPSGAKGNNIVLIERCLQVINKEWIVEIVHV